MQKFRTLHAGIVRKGISLFFIGLILFIPSGHIQAQTGDDLQVKINQRTADIQALQKEIQGYQKQLDVIGGQADTLASTIKSLDLTQKKLAADIKVTENKIAAKNFEIEQLSGQISDKESTISDDRHIIAYSFEMIHQLGSQSIPELLLASQSLSAGWNSLDELSSVQKSLFDHIDSLQNTKKKLEGNRVASQKAKNDLVALNNQIKDQRSVVLSTTAEKNALLAQTKQSESEYKKVLSDRQAQADAIQREIDSYESQLHLSVNTSNLPRSGSGILNWPLDAVFVTQYFGNTSFSSKNPQIYNGKGHNGVDFRAAIGTPVKSALSGTVVGVSNTSAIAGCYSYGKWIMVKHPNGLSTLYSHLSLQSVRVGDTVGTGEIIGYSGNSGNVTGPHLHFGVYATEGVRITAITRNSFPNSHCIGAVIPFADWTAYLNPLSYL